MSPPYPPFSRLENPDSFGYFCSQLPILVSCPSSGPPVSLSSHEHTKPKCNKDLRQAVGTNVQPSRVTTTLTLDAKLHKVEVPL